MKFIAALERRFDKFAISNLTLYLIAGQTVFYLLYHTGQLQRDVTSLAAAWLWQGEWWRVVTFVFDPPAANLLFAFFAWYLFYLMGSALESHWGTFRYNVFLLIGYLLTVGCSFLVPGHIVSNAYLGGSVFLAFAFLYPDFQLYLFFLLPVKIKWLALLAWLGYGYAILAGDWGTRLVVLASLGNFLLFFGDDLVYRLKNGRRRMHWQARNLSRPEKDFIHRCTVCGITDQTHPEMDFRYCSTCNGQRGYCQEHIRNHDHVRAEEESGEQADEKRPPAA